MAPSSLHSPHYSPVAVAALRQAGRILEMHQEEAEEIRRQVETESLAAVRETQPHDLVPVLVEVVCRLFSSSLVVDRKRADCLGPFPEVAACLEDQESPVLVEVVA